MKTTNILNDLSELPFLAGNGDDTITSPHSGSTSQRTSEGARRAAGRTAESAEDFREMLRRRATTPFVSAIPYHRFGINE